ncbi:hypothetical protein ACFQZ2_04565 [Streptomonospora algeriensis]
MSGETSTRPQLLTESALVLVLAAAARAQARPAASCSSAAAPSPTSPQHRHGFGSGDFDRLDAAAGLIGRNRTVQAGETRPRTVPRSAGAHRPPDTVLQARAQD